MSDDFSDQLTRATTFSYISLYFSYYVIKVLEEVFPKTAFASIMDNASSSDILETHFYLNYNYGPHELGLQRVSLHVHDRVHRRHHHILKL